MIENANVTRVFEGYPKHIQARMMSLRQLIAQTASENESVGEIEETLKWGEPSYLSCNGSTIRMGWKNARPDEYAMYFHCQTKLVDTFRELYRDKLSFEGNRAIVFNANDDVPVDELKHCVLLALTYHDRKHLSLLGA